MENQKQRVVDLITRVQPGRVAFRPEGWINPYVEYSTPRNKFPTRSRAFEAGADAMLEGLKGEGEYITTNGKPYGLVLGKTLHTGDKGWLVFIPEDVPQTPE